MYNMVGLYSHTNCFMTRIMTTEYKKKICILSKGLGVNQCRLPKKALFYKAARLLGTDYSFPHETFVDVNELYTGTTYYLCIISTSNGNSHIYSAGCVSSPLMLDALVYISLPKSSKLLRHVNVGLLQC